MCLLYKIFVTKEEVTMMLGNEGQKQFFYWITWKYKKMKINLWKTDECYLIIFLLMIWTKFGIKKIHQKILSTVEEFWELTISELGFRYDGETNIQIDFILFRGICKKKIIYCGENEMSEYGIKGYFVA